MIKFNAAPAFDFDEWATLYQRDPEAFEARRKAMLAIEIAKGGVHAEAGKQLVEKLEAQLAGKTDAQRINLSMLAMVASAKSMAERLSALGDSLQQHAAAAGNRPGRPDGPARPTA